MFNIYIVGCGATGSNLLSSLAQYSMNEKKVNSITLIDGDVVERKNFRNQKFFKKDINKNKAYVLSKRYSLLGIDISFIDEYLKDSNKLIDIISNDNDLDDFIPLIISCVDNNNARIILNEVFHSKRIPNLIYIDAGNGTDERLGQMIIGSKYNNVIKSEPVCSYFPEILDGDPVVKENFSCSQIITEKPQSLTTNVLSATSIFLEVVNLITYNKFTGVFFTFNAETMNLKKVK